MSLVKQLIAATLLVTLCLLAGTLFLVTESSKRMLLNQLESHGQDAATNLGLYLAPFMGERDEATIEVAVNAIFDSGFYQRIDILDNAGNTLFSKTRPFENDDSVPAWFVALVDIEPPEMFREVTNNWSKVGSVHVQSRAGYAYAEFWKGIKNSLIWFGGLAIISSFTIGWVLWLLLRPLKGVEEQAQALSERRFIQQEKIPGARELRRVVVAMNQMVTQVRLMFDEQSRHIEDLRRTAYQDNLTGLPNQRAAESRLAERLDFRQDFGNGILLYLRITNLALLNNQLGMERASNFIKVVASQLEKHAQDADNSIVGRLTGADFILLIKRVDEDAQNRLLDEIFSNITANYSALKSSVVIEKCWPIHIGVAYSNDQTRYTQLLAEARLALQTAEESDQPHFVYRSRDLTTSQDNSSWHQHVADAVNNQEIFLQSQVLVPAKDSQHAAQQEILARILDQNGNPCSAGEFISVIKQLGLMVSLDRAVIQLALDFISSNSRSDTIAINLSTDALQSEEFLEWFEKRVSQFQYPEKLSIEISESAILNNLSQAKRFRDLLKTQKINFGVDNFGVHPSGFSYLYNLQPNYIKIDGSLIRKIDQQAEDRFFVSSLIHIAHSLHIQAYAEHVERETQRMELQNLEIDGTQGWLHGQPKQLGSSN